MSSTLEPSPGNLFQEIKKQCIEAEAKGIKLIRLSIGQPAGPGHIIAREASAKALMSDYESIHEYQDNGSPGCPDFARRFVHTHPGNKKALRRVEDNVSYLPIPGIKPMLGYVVESLGGWEKPEKKRKVLTTPGYPTPAYQACKAKNVVHHQMPSFSAKQGFLPTMEQIHSFDLGEGDLIMLNLPNNPTGAVADTDWWQELCLYCAMNGIRIFNDAAYAILKHDSDIPNLAEIASQYPKLDWCEAYSASKAGNFCGWRIGAMVGSNDFISDISRIKGESDSGFNAALACGIIELFEKHPDEISKIADTYHGRLGHLIHTLGECGMKKAIHPKAGFFALFHVPKTAFGQEVRDGAHFNELMINNVGIVGVPFGRYIRYAVCTYEVEKNTDVLYEIFRKAEVSY